LKFPSLKTFIHMPYNISIKRVNRKFQISMHSGYKLLVTFGVKRRRSLGNVCKQIGQEIPMHQSHLYTCHTTFLLSFIQFRAL
jgi:hypothetical protein